MTEQTDLERPGVAAAVIVQNGRVLMVRRRTSEGDVSWQFPAGKIEPGESPKQAAVRETQEETSLVVSVIRLLGERVHPMTGRLMSYLACEVVSGTTIVAAPDEVAELVWVALAEIGEYVPYGLFGPVQQYFKEVLPDGATK